MPSYVLEIRPQVKERARVGKWGGYTPSATRDFERMVAFLLSNEMARNGDKMLTGPIYLSINFVLKRPKKAKHVYPSKGDLSNYIKAIEDASNGILWNDDTQVVEVHATKVYGVSDRIEILVEETVVK